MSISTQIQRIQQAKTDIKAAISDKGVTVPDNATIDTYPTYVSQISSGDYEQLFIDMIERDIKSVIIPDGVTTIGSMAFAYCSRLKSVTIPSTVSFISGGAFQSCTFLTDIAIPDGVTTIGSMAFASCSSLKSITIPDGVTTIDSSTFKYCSALTDVTIGSGVKTIGNYAFEYCSALTNITIPNSVTKISGDTFYSCSALTAITVLATTPPTLGANAFYNTNNCPIYVPAASLDAYKTATNWVNYADRIFAITE